MNLQKNKRFINKIVKNLVKKQSLSEGEFYFFVSSFLMYFIEPLVNESWNTFPLKINNKEITIEEGLFLTDDKKIPDVHKYITKKKLYNILLETKNQLMLQYPKLYKDLQKNNSFMIIKHNKENVSIPYSEKISSSDNTKKQYIVTNDKIKVNEIVRKHVEKLEKILNQCKICNTIKDEKNNLPFKSLEKHKTIYFCSLNCLNKWKV